MKQQWGNIYLNPWRSPFVVNWRVSKLCPKKKTVSNACCAELIDESMGWQPLLPEKEKRMVPFANIHKMFDCQDGIVYLGNHFRVKKDGKWTLCVGHDGGAAVFVAGKRVLCQPHLINPAIPGRSLVTVNLNRGLHEIVVALDTDHGSGWGMFFCFELPAARRKKGLKPVFPVATI